MSWTQNYKLREFARKVILFSALAAVVYGGYNLHKQGMFRGGVKPAIYRISGRIPLVGRQIQKLLPFKKYSYERSHVAKRGKRGRHHRGRRHRR